MNMYGIYLFRKQKMGYIQYSKNINASHICPPNRNTSFEQRKCKNVVSAKSWTMTCKTHVKVTCCMKTWNDPTVITDILPQTIPRKTIIKVSVWQKCWNPCFRQTQHWKTWKMDLATKSRPPDSGITVLAPSSSPTGAWYQKPKNVRVP